MPSADVTSTPFRVPTSAVIRSGAAMRTAPRFAALAVTFTGSRSRLSAPGSLAPGPAARACVRALGHVAGSQ